LFKNACLQSIVWITLAAAWATRRCPALVYATIKQPLKSLLNTVCALWI